MAQFRARTLQLGFAALAGIWQPRDEETGKWLKRSVVFPLVGGVVGAQFGTTLGARMKAEQLRILLALLVLAVCGKLALDLLLQPAELYEIGTS